MPLYPPLLLFVSDAGSWKVQGHRTEQSTHCAMWHQDMYGLFWKVSRYAISLWEETFGEMNTQGVTHLWMCGRFSTVVWGICCKTLCGDLWGLMLIFFSFVEPPSLATSDHSCLIFFRFLQQFWFDPRTLIAKKPLPNVSVHGNKKIQVLGQHSNKKCRSLHIKLWRSGPDFFSRHSSPVLFLV